MNVRPRSSVYNSDQTERLRLFEAIDDDGGGNFHSLVWAQLLSGDFVGGEWKTRHEITSDEFQAHCPRRRWVAALHSIYPSEGTAIIQVGEGNLPMKPASGVTQFSYSWRLWDLANNRELKLLKQCADPFEEFEQR